MRKVDIKIARKVVLGCHGLWPGRRHNGISGIADAIRESNCIQVDPINVVGRSHDLALFSRVEKYSPSDLDQLLYTDRSLVEYGRILMIYPKERLTLLQMSMKRMHGLFVAGRPSGHEVVEQVRKTLRERGPMSGRDFVDREKIIGGYGHQKDTTNALESLWLGGELITHSKRGTDRVYYFLEHHFDLAESHTVEDAEDEIVYHALCDLVIGTVKEIAVRSRILIYRTILKEMGGILDRFMKDGRAIKLEVAGRSCFAPAFAAEWIDELEANTLPARWRPIAASKSPEVRFIAPLDNVIWDRDRASALFGFDYLWEVYKPQEKRKYGYYTLPIVFGSEFVGRTYLHVERKANVLQIRGFWLEEEQIGRSAQFARAFRREIEKLMAWNGANRIEIQCALPDSLKNQIL